MYNLHDNESINTPLDLRLYNRFNKTRRLRIKRGKLKKLPKSKYSFYAHHLKNSSQQFNNCLQTSFKQSDTFNCSICNMETINFNMFIQHMVLHLNQLTNDTTINTLSDKHSLHECNKRKSQMAMMTMTTMTAIMMTMMTSKRLPFNEILNNEQLSFLLTNEYLIKQNNQSNKQINECLHLMCNICKHELIFEQFTNLMDHLQTKHLSIEYRCNGCHQIFSDRIQCLVHILCQHITTVQLLTDNNHTTNNLTNLSSSSSNNNNPMITTNNNNVLCDDNENITCKYQHSNNVWCNNTLLRNMYQNNPMIINELNDDNHLEDHVNTMEKSSANCNCHTQSLIHFLSMLFWRSLSSINWMQSDTDELVDKHIKVLNTESNQSHENRISISDECTQSVTLTSASSASSSILNLQADYVTQESTHKTINMVLLDEVKSRQMNQSIEENQSNEVNQIDLYQTSLNCVHLLRSHPVLGLLPHEIASKVDSYKASRICHLCLKEFADEMTVLHHQVEEHSLDDQSNVINSINQ
ncbi:hypothetical protein EWB00_010209 [Schistosoma japonicum]|uniref:C2H2-type domain-containing protein n=2 Tax=Schistosoma japonicum TaxID=6182 RepID=A0A4Z2DPG3_SCHJA|nr:hypothetical protein KSF78_0002341 [Schistosoma japonicum]TNN18415.1 hypothetical protein EWB00_010209 [Schistosoma japonicum]